MFEELADTSLLQWLAGNTPPLQRPLADFVLKAHIIRHYGWLVTSEAVQDDIVGLEPGPHNTISWHSLVRWAHDRVL